MKSSVAKGIPPEKWLSPDVWRKVTETMPIPCVDIIFERTDAALLYGWRLITPYRQVWALVGGRILWGESLQQCAFRIAKEYGLGFCQLYLNGVFPVSFPNRSDVVISLAARKISGQPQVDGFEFSKFTWSRKPPKRLGRNYLRMITQWSRVGKSKDYLKLNRLS
jgi:ADP-ribose pyrophosphatase YjhB (NUDIX family)